MRKRMLMPIPTDIVAHADFKDLFGDSAGSMPYVRARSASMFEREAREFQSTQLSPLALLH